MCVYVGKRPLFSESSRPQEASLLEVKGPRADGPIGAVVDDFKHKGGGVSTDKGIHSVKGGECVRGTCCLVSLLHVCFLFRQHRALSTSWASSTAATLLLLGKQVERREFPPRGDPSLGAGVVAWCSCNYCASLMEARDAQEFRAVSSTLLRPRPGCLWNASEFGPVAPCSPLPWVPTEDEFLLPALPAFSEKH